MNAKYERQLKKGVFEILVLKLLSEGEKYGYELLMELKERGGEMFAVKEGTLYPILYRLEDDGLASSRWSRALTSASGTFSSRTPSAFITGLRPR